MRPVYFRHTALLFIALAIFTIQGCTRRGGPSLETVSATADWVAVIDLKQINQDSASAHSHNPAAIISSLLPEEFSYSFRILTPYIDNDRLIIFKPAETRGPVAAAGVSDPSAFADALKADSWSKIKVNGETAYAPEGAREFSPCLFIEGKTVFLVATRSDMRNLRLSLKSADSDNYLTKVPKPLLPAESELTFFASLPDNDNELICIKAQTDPSNNSISFRAIITESGSDKSGEPIEMSFLKPLESDSIPGLSELPGGYSLRGVFGIPSGINWKALADIADGSLDTRSLGLLQSLLPYMSRLDGPLAVGIGPFDFSNMTADRLEAQTIYVCATFQPGKAAEVVNEINGNLREKGLDPRPGANGIYAFNLNGTSYRYVSRGNEFLFAQNREINDKWDSDIEIDPKTTGSLTLMLPPLRSIIPDAPSNNSISASLKMTSKEINLTITCTSGSPLVALPTYFESISTALRNFDLSNEDYFDTY
ncbi:MAG: hypothetical protein K2L46_00995 [Paramuribaculum sp.]|nr:hypothetical protein [Paramuribaculum sp.]